MTTCSPADSRFVMRFQSEQIRAEGREEREAGEKRSMDDEMSGCEVQRYAHRGGSTPCITFHQLCLDMPRGGRLIVTRHRGPYWFFHLPWALLTHRRIEHLGDWIVSTPIWQIDAMRPVWATMRDGWRPYLEWCGASGISPDIFVSRCEVHIDWASPSRRYCGGWRWETIPPFEEFERRTADFVHRLARTGQRFGDLPTADQ